ncbi:hypothetical protein FRC04_011181 [Tulasnella sp. 424]|nr:hypothetical protein FRC04_011181 [Tulasnella sp. 424]
MGDVVLSGTSTSTVAEGSPFAINPTRRDTLAQLPDVLVPSSREPSPGFDERVASMVAFIERASSKTPKNLPSLLNLLTGDLSGFVVGASSWGEERPVKKEKGGEEEKWRSGDGGFATYEEEAEAREQFKASIVAGGGHRQPGMAPLSHGPSPNKKRKINKGERIAARIDPSKQDHGLQKLSMRGIGHSINPTKDGPPRPQTPPPPHDRVSSALQGSPFKPASSFRRPMEALHHGGENDAAIAPSAAGSSRLKPRGNFDPNLSEEFYPPSFPSDLMTSTPASNRQKPPPIIPISDRPLGFAAAIPSPGFAQITRFKVNAPIRPVIISRPVQNFNPAPANPEHDPPSSPRRSSSVVSDPEAEQEPPDPPPVTLAALGRAPTVDDLLIASSEKRRLERMAARPVKKLPRRSGSGPEDNTSKWHQERSRAVLSEPSSLLPTQQRSTQNIPRLGSPEPSPKEIEPVHEDVRRRRSSLSSSSTASSHQPRDADGGGGSGEDDALAVSALHPASRSSSPSVERPRRRPGLPEERKSIAGGLKFGNLVPPSQSHSRQAALQRSNSGRGSAGAESDRPGSGVKDRLPQSSSSSLGGHAAFLSQFDVERNVDAIGGMLDEDVWP